MNNLFVEFIKNLEKMSGNHNLCEAVLQGYLECHPIFEDAEGRAASKTRDFIRKRFGELANSIARDENGEPILTQKGNEQTVLDCLERQIRDMFFHNDYANIKFEPGVARIMFDDIGMQVENYDVRRTETLKGILKIISSAHADEYDADLNGMSLEQLEDRFGENMVAASEADYERVSSATYTKNNSYRIVEIRSFDEAKKYYEYTNPNSRWCLTHMENMWDTYSGNGRNKVYFVLKDWFEDMKPVKGENCPLDEYGLSMICVIVTNDISDENRPTLCTCTCRWNHENGGSDQIMNVEQISNVIGESFYNAFKPFSLEELHAKGMYTFKEKIEKYNKTHDKNVFGYIGRLKDGYAAVELNLKWSFINKDGELAWGGNKWFDDVGDFNDGYARVELNGKGYNFIDKEGEFLWKGDKWFDGAWHFHEGYARVLLNRKGFNFIDKEGEFLWKGDKLFDNVLDFNDGYARVELNGKWSFINGDGELIGDGDKWFDSAQDFNDGYSLVGLNGRCSFIDNDGELIGNGNVWFDYGYSFRDGYALVKLNGEYYKIDMNGNLYPD